MTKERLPPKDGSVGPDHGFFFPLPVYNGIINDHLTQEKTNMWNRKVLIERTEDSLEIKQ